MSDPCGAVVVRQDAFHVEQDQRRGCSHLIGLAAKASRSRCIHRAICVWSAGIFYYPSTKKPWLRGQTRLDGGGRFWTPLSGSESDLLRDERLQRNALRRFKLLEFQSIGTVVTLRVGPLDIPDYRVAFDVDVGVVRVETKRQMDPVIEFRIRLGNG